MARVARQAPVYNDENAAPAALRPALPRARSALGALSADVSNRTKPDANALPTKPNANAGADVVKPRAVATAALSSTGASRPAMSTLMNNATGGAAHNTFQSTLVQRASVAGAAASAAAAAAAATVALQTGASAAGPVTAAALAATRAPVLLAGMSTGVPPIRRTGSFSASLTGATAAVAAATAGVANAPALQRQTSGGAVAPTGFSFAATAAANVQRAAAANSAASAVLSMPPPAARPTGAALPGAVAAAAAAATHAAVSCSNTGGGDLKDEHMGNTSVCVMDDDDEVNRSLSGLSLDADAAPAVAAAPAPSILADLEDKKDPQMVVDYIDDIMEHLKRSEVKRHPKTDYLSRQNDLNPKMREILVDWLVDVHLRLHLQPETMFLCVNYIDRFLSKREVFRNKLQLIGCTALLVAAKYEEMYPPDINKFVVICANAFDRKEFLAMEQVVLLMLDFNLTVATPHRFAQRFARVARLSRTATTLVHYLVELTLQEYKFLKHLPSHIAASAVFIAAHAVAVHNKLPATADDVWNGDLVLASGYGVEDIKKCVKDLHALYSAEPTKFLAVRKKYAAEEYRKVSTAIPPLALPF